LKFLQFIHRLDADTTGILLFGKSQGAVRTFGELFESRRMEKIYLAVVEGIPKQADWNCQLKMAPNPSEIGKVKVDPRNGKSAETLFKVLESRDGRTLIEAHPVTGRTHQIRVHLAESGFPIVGDPLYGTGAKLGKKEQPQFPIGLRAVFLSYNNPFDRRRVQIKAPPEEFLNEFGFRSWPAPAFAPAKAHEN
jgi:RluA family pseudouridine synthase